MKGNLGVPVRNVRVSSSARVIRANIYWNQRMINRKGSRDRFNIRVTAFGPSGASDSTVLTARSTTSTPAPIQRLTLRLTKSQGKIIRESDDVVLAVSQQYGVTGNLNNRYFRQFATIKQLNGGRSSRSISPSAATSAEERSGRNCYTRQIQPDTDMARCDLSRANLTNCDVTRVDFTRANLAGTLLRGCDVNGAEFAGADLDGLVSGDLIGTPASLPAGWIMTGGRIEPDVTPAPAAPAITSATSTSGVEQAALTAFTVTTTGTPTPAITHTGTLPTGVTLTDNGNGTATLSGTPAASTAGTYPLVITATNGTAPAATQNFTLTITPAPTFAATWDTQNTGGSSSNADQISLPLESGGTYDFTVNWGDSTSDHITAYDAAAATHTYTTPGEYTISITGTINGFRFAGGGDSAKLLNVASWGPLKFGNNGGYFQAATNMTSTATDVPDLTGTTNLSNMFNGAYAFNGDISAWTTSNVTDMSNMFNEAYSFNGDVGNWDTSAVTDMSYMFSNTSMNGDIGSWNTSNVANMQGTFYESRGFNQDISSWDPSAVTNMSSMFDTATSFNQPIGTWDTSAVTTMADMFIRATSFNQPLGTWDVSSVTTTDRMFQQATAFDQTLDSWDTSALASTIQMFAFASAFNQDLDSWDTSALTTMGAMFYNAIAFNGALGAWDTSAATSMSSVFGGASSFDQDISAWNTSNVTAMNHMFWRAATFNQDISSWDTSSATSTANMFDQAETFNQDISSWDTSNVVDMEYMFSAATAFNQDLGSWDISNVADMTAMFSGITLSVPNYDSLLTGWASQLVQPNVPFNGGASQYSGGAPETARDVLTASPNNWHISDGGLFVVAPSITSAASTSRAEQTEMAAFTVTTTGAPTPAIVLTSGSLPIGVTFVDNGDGTGTLSGTPADATAGTYPLVFTAANNVLPDATQNFTLTITP